MTPSEGGLKSFFFFFACEFLEANRAVSDFADAADRTESILSSEYNRVSEIVSKLMSKDWTSGEY